MRLEENARTVSKDLDSGARKFDEFDVFRIAELLGVAQTHRPENSWSFCTAVYINSVEECIIDCMIEDIDEMCEWLEEHPIVEDRLAEIRFQGESAMKHKKPKSEFLDNFESESLETKAAERQLERLVGNGIGCDATYNVELDGIDLWFRGAIEDDGACINLKGPHDGID